MNATRTLLGCWLAMLPGAASSAEAVPAADMLAAHNAVRSQLDLPPLTWSRALAGDAAKWADHLADRSACKLQHAEAAGQGENLFWASPELWSDGRREVQAITSAAVVNSWASEQSDYDYASNSCRDGKVCGHYTQIVWRTTEQVGCAKRVCADQSQIWVCRYLPPGNWIGEKPY